MSRTAREWSAAPQLPDDHFIKADIYTDELIYKDEIEKIFKKTWQIACHESEIPQVGDYRALTVATMPVLVIRGLDGKVRSFLNACSHRSSMVLSAPAGNTKRIVCPFHLWTYDTKGRCVERTRECGYEKQGPAVGEAGLREIKTEICYGIVFINLDDNAHSLETHVGNSWDIIKDVVGAKLEVFHYHEFVIEANWKQWQETNMELYHEWGHPVNRRTSVMADGYFDRKWEIHPNGHGWLTPFAVNYTNYKGWEQRTDKPLPGLQPDEYRILDLFPNISIMMRATSLRIDTSTPLGPNKTLVQFRGLGIQGESAEDREMRQRHHNQVWGPFGRNLPEDVIFVEAVAPNNKTGSAQHAVISRHENMSTQDDEVIRAYYRTWARYMDREPADIEHRRLKQNAIGASR